VLEVKSQRDKDVSRSPFIEVGGERDTSMNISAAASMTEFREVKLTVDGLRVLESRLRSKASLTKIELTHTLKWGEVKNRSRTSGL
jgi:hypothetical protein